MSRLIRFLLPVVALSLLAGCAGGPAQNTRAGGTQSAMGNSSEADGNYRIPKQIRYSFTLTNTGGKPLEKAQFWTYLPVPQTSHQKVKKIAANHPYQEKRDELGNSSIHFELGSIPPYGTEIVSITVDLLMSARAVEMPVGNQSRFLSREPYIETDNDRIVALASQLYGDPALGMVREDYEWVAHNITYEGYVAEDRGAAYAMEKRKGDCTEFAYLLTALYRAQKIPARAIGGYVFSGNGVAKAVDYHNWTEFYLDGAWQIADAQKGAFAEKQRNYVAMRVIASGGTAALASQRFSYAGEGLKVEMN
ncbi:MAG TPA: transglutaminase-like domain-containing protein [Gallionella sp.]|nr:transglutaminase-like domain-containing protein [Gallionella sp.]